MNIISPLAISPKIPHSTVSHAKVFGNHLVSSKPVTFFYRKKTKYERPFLYKTQFFRTKQTCLKTFQHLFYNLKSLYFKICFELYEPNRSKRITAKCISQTPSKQVLGKF